MNQENNFVRLGKVLIRFPKIALSALAIIMVALVIQLPDLEVDTTAEGFLLPGSKPILDYNDFRKQFGRDEFFLVIITGQEVFDLDFLQNLKAFHEALSLGVTRLQSVESLVNVRSIYGDEDDLVAEDLLEEFPETEEQLAEIRERIRGKKLYYGRLINDAEDTVAIFVKQSPYMRVTNKNGEEVYKALGDTEIARGAEEIQTVADRFRDRFEGEIYIGGTPALGSYMSTVLQRDFGVFTAVALSIVGIILTFLFKRLSGVLMPLFIMVLGIVATISLMPVLGYPMQITTSILPSFLLAVCIGDSVHLLSIFYRQYDNGAGKQEALLYAMNHTGIAVLFTSLTTAAGLLTFSFSEIQPIASLGLFAAIGSLLAFVITMTVLPILISLLPIRHKQFVDNDKMKEGGLLYRFAQFCIHLSTVHPKKVVAVAIVLAIASLSLIPSMRFSQDSLTWLPEDNSVRVAINIIEEKITGSMPVEVVIDTGEAQGAIDPELLKRLDKWLGSIEGQTINTIDILSVNSLINLIKETNQAFNGNNDEAYRIPDDQQLIAQELLLVELDQADDLYAYTDNDFRQLRVTIIVPWSDAIVFESFLEQLTASFHHAVGQDHAMHITGVLPVFSTMFSAMIASAAQSYMIAAVAITMMMIIFIRGIPDGLLSMVPNFLPIIMVLAFMVVVDIPMDVFTVLIGSIALGICVDDTVHFMHGFKTAYAQHGDAAKAIEQTLLSTGKALMITSIVLFWGFMTFILSDFVNMDNFGILTAMCIVLALLADFIVAPSIMMLRYGNVWGRDKG